MPSHPIELLFIGLLMAQILATVQVYLSNLDLYATVSAASVAGYLAIPNQQVMAGLQNFAPAFFGGLFFTFTIRLAGGIAFRQHPGVLPDAHLIFSAHSPGYFQADSEAGIPSDQPVESNAATGAFNSHPIAGPAVVYSI